MLNLERIPDQVGYLLLTEDGAVISVSIIFHESNLHSLIVCPWGCSSMAWLAVF
jgi:hypothetical protein